MCCALHFACYRASLTSNSSHHSSIVAPSAVIVGGGSVRMRARPIASGEHWRASVCATTPRGVTYEQRHSPTKSSVVIAMNNDEQSPVPPKTPAEVKRAHENKRHSVVYESAKKQRPPLSRLVHVPYVLAKWLCACVCMLTRNAPVVRSYLIHALCTFAVDHAITHHSNNTNKTSCTSSMRFLNPNRTTTRPCAGRRCVHNAHTHTLQASN